MAAIDPPAGPGLRRRRSAWAAAKIRSLSIRSWATPSFRRSVSCGTPTLTPAGGSGVLSTTWEIGVAGSPRGPVNTTEWGTGTYTLEAFGTDAAGNASTPVTRVFVVDQVNPTTTIRKSFVKGQVWNPSQWDDPAYESKMMEVYRERDEEKRKAMLREMTREILDKAPYVGLPTPYIYTAWWPWVKNYNGEMRAGAVRPGPIYARIWVDQEMKKQMGS